MFFPSIDCGEFSLSYLDEIPRITAMKYIPTDGMCRTSLSIRRLMMQCE